MAMVNSELGTIDNATFDDNLACAQAGAERLAEQRAYDQAERTRAAVDEPAMQAKPEAAAIAKAEADQDADLEI